MRSCVEYVGYYGTTSGTPAPVKSAADDIEEEQQTSCSAVGLGHAVSGYAQSGTEDRSAANDVEQPASSEHLNSGAASSSSVANTPGTIPVEHLGCFFANASNESEQRSLSENPPDLESVDANDTSFPQVGIDSAVPRPQTNANADTDVTAYGVPIAVPREEDPEDSPEEFSLHEIISDELVEQEEQRPDELSSEFADRVERKIESLFPVCSTTWLTHKEDMKMELFYRGLFQDDARKAVLSASSFDEMIMLASMNETTWDWSAPGDYDRRSDDVVQTIMSTSSAHSPSTKSASYEVWTLTADTSNGAKLLVEDGFIEPPTLCSLRHVPLKSQASETKVEPFNFNATLGREESSTYTTEYPQQSGKRLFSLKDRRRHDRATLTNSLQFSVPGGNLGTLGTCKFKQYSRSDSVDGVAFKFHWKRPLFRRRVEKRKRVAQLEFVGRPKLSRLKGNKRTGTLVHRRLQTEADLSGLCNHRKKHCGREVRDMFANLTDGEIQLSSQKSLIAAMIDENNSDWRDFGSAVLQTLDKRSSRELDINCAVGCMKEMNVELTLPSLPTFIARCVMLLEFERQENLLRGGRDVLTWLSGLYVFPRLALTVEECMAIDYAPTYLSSKSNLSPWCMESMQIVSNETVEIINFFLGEEFFPQYFKKPPEFSDLEDDSYQSFWDQNKKLVEQLDLLQKVWWNPVTCSVFQTAYDVLKYRLHLKRFQLFGKDSLGAMALRSLTQKAEKLEQKTWFENV